MKHHIKHHTFCLTMRFLSMWAKHRKNYAYNLISKLFAGKTQLMEKPESCLHWNALAPCNLLWRKCTHAHIGCIGHTHILAVATINPASANCEIVFAGIVLSIFRCISSSSTYTIGYDQQLTYSDVFL